MNQRLVTTTLAYCICALFTGGQSRENNEIAQLKREIYYYKHGTHVNIDLIHYQDSIKNQKLYSYGR